MVDFAVSDVRSQGLSGRLYASRGAGKSRAEGEAAPAFVLVHGIGVSHRYLLRLHQLLAETTDTYSIDLPGFGGTPKPGRQLSVGDYADFILAALDEAGVTSCVLVGHSMGTQFAVEAAARQPDRFTELVLMGPVVDPRRRTVMRQALDLTTDCAFFESPSSNLIVLTDYIRCGPRWYLTELPIMMSYPLEERIGDVGVPVLVPRTRWHRATGARFLRRALRQGNFVRSPAAATSSSTPAPPPWLRPSWISPDIPTGLWKRRHERSVAQSALVGPGLRVCCWLANPRCPVADEG
jgi:pimeloyl-ACP methyl ester carboxylesterase